MRNISISPSLRRHEMAKTCVGISLPSSEYPRSDDCKGSDLAISQPQKVRETRSELDGVQHINEFRKAGERTAP